MVFYCLLWLIEIYFIISLLGLLIYAIVRASNFYIEYNNNTKNGYHNVKDTTAGNVISQNIHYKTGNVLCLSGPSWLQQNLSLWSVVWCIMAAVLLWDNSLKFVFPSGLFIRDTLNVNLSIILFCFAAIFLLLSRAWMNYAQIVHVEYLPLVLLAILGQHLILMCTDFMSLYVSLEIQSFCLVVLCCFHYNSFYSVEAGMKYFLLSAFSSCLMLFGICLIYATTAITNCTHLQELLLLSQNCPNAMNVATTSTNVSEIFLLGVWLISLTLLWKLAAAPMHMWAADVYMGAWSIVTLFISTLPKLAVLGFWVHLWHNIWQYTFTDTMIFFSAFSMLVGALCALGQVHMKRLIAYSSIGHMGFLLMPLCMEYSGAAISALFTHLIIYFVTSIAVWGIFMWPFYRNGSVMCATPQYMWDFSVMWKTLPLSAITMAIAMMSLAGLPPVAGFLGKLGIFWWSVNAHQYFLLAIALLSTLISSVYYLRVIRVMYMDVPSRWSVFHRMSMSNAYIIGISLLLSVVVLWYSSPLVLVTHILGISC